MPMHHIVLLEEMLALSRRLEVVCARGGDLRIELEAAMVRARASERVAKDRLRAARPRKPARSTRR